MYDEESNFDPADFFLHKGGHEENIDHRNDRGYEPVNDSFGSLRDFVNSPFNTPFTISGDDLFFKHLYEYHQGSGLICIFLTEICYLLTVLFSILFSTFLMTCVDWKSIHDGRKNNLHDAVYPMCRPENGRNGMVTFSFCVFIIYWFIMVYRTVIYLMRIRKIHELWIGRLGLSTDVQWVTWQMVIDAYHDRIDQTVDSHYIVSRIMRWDNYLIAMLMKNVFGWDAFNGIFTKVLEWNVHKCISSALFRDDGILIRDVVLPAKKQEYVQRLRKSFMVYGVINLLCMPFVFSALLVYFIYRYVSEYHKNPKAMGLYSFTPLAKWKLRDFNEMPHVYTARLNKAHPKIIEYLGQFVNEGYTIIVKFVSFILGSTLLILVGVSFFYPDIIISLFITEKPVIFYVGVLGILFAAVQNNSVDEPLVYEPDKKFDELIDSLHGTVPTSWANMSTKDRYMEIRKLFKYKWMVWIMEILSVIYVPFLLLFWLPNKAENIVNFFRENSVHVATIGNICSCASFDSQQPLMKTKTSEEDDDIDSVTSSMERKLEMKMSTSVMNFRQNYTWDPNRFKRNVVTSNVINQEYEERLRLLRLQKEQRERQEREQSRQEAENQQRHNDIIREYEQRTSLTPHNQRSVLSQQLTNEQQILNASASTYQTANGNDLMTDVPFANEHVYGSYKSTSSNKSYGMVHDLNASNIINQMAHLNDTPSSTQETNASSVPLDINLPFPINLVDEVHEDRDNVE